MGRMDGDMAVDGVNQTPEAFQRECERLKAEHELLQRKKWARWQRAENERAKADLREEPQEGGATEAGTIEGWRRECERLRKENTELQAECWQVRGRVTQLETQLKAGRQCVAERDEEIEQLLHKIECYKELEKEPPLSVQKMNHEHMRELMTECDALRDIIKHMAPLL